ncbi:NAD(P)H-binding protein [Aquimarina sp. U1-2]|uniref:NAD(P)H-binding protein n=1 Tax=Aquimarina sp. U1-2 TaxID=2823141 RepID=UPI001AECEDE2|nr:NAD(P)H-binding protein [Aquimarina sp. U1-2]MBP2833779.1 NAD(P)H-binding protein [Aquimarina sp. U1-2]
MLKNRNVLVVGANGKTGSLIVETLIDHDVQVVGLIRSEHQESKLKAIGAKALVKDINDSSIQNDLKTIDALIFAAAGGSGSHQEVDHQGVKNLIQGCQANNVKRFVLISALGAHDPNSWGRCL